MRFLLPAAVLTVVMPLVVSYAFRSGWISDLPSFLYESTWLVAFITAVIFIYLYRLSKPSVFVQFYLLSMVVKLLAALAYSLLMIKQDRAGGVANVLYLLGIYMLFTSLEIICLYKRISRSTRA